jgi:hypothetical protein
MSLKIVQKLCCTFLLYMFFIIHYLIYDSEYRNIKMVTYVYTLF